MREHPAVASLPAPRFAAAGHRYSIDGERLNVEGGSASIDYFMSRIQKPGANNSGVVAI
jgi:hypothetical protein